jgi:hypothetical protein
MSDELSAADGISDYDIAFEGLDAEDGGSATVRFRISNGDGHSGTLSFFVEPENDGVAGLIARGHDQLIDALRQMLYRANVLRAAYRTQAGQHNS